jgi:broad specificity phosphatase PhoE
MTSQSGPDGGPGNGPRADRGNDRSDDRTTVVHLLRHGEVHNPTGILYGRLPGYNLSDLGGRMARRVGEALARRDVTHLVASPLERAQDTARPLADMLGLDIVTDQRVIEAGNHFEGKSFGVGEGALRRPSTWWYLRNPWKPSWGEPYKQIVDRMLGAMADARAAAHGHEAVIVTHQLPVWITRSAVEGLPFLHDPRRRQCTLCSLTSFSYVDEEIVSVSYSEPAADLLPAKGANAPFSAGA